MILDNIACRGLINVDCGVSTFWLSTPIDCRYRVSLEGVGLGEWVLLLKIDDRAQEDIVLEFFLFLFYFSFFIYMYIYREREKEAILKF